MVPYLQTGGCSATSFQTSVWMSLCAWRRSALCCWFNFCRLLFGDCRATILDSLRVFSVVALDAEVPGQLPGRNMISLIRLDAGSIDCPLIVRLFTRQRTCTSTMVSDCRPKATTPIFSIIFFTSFHCAIQWRCVHVYLSQPWAKEVGNCCYSTGGHLLWNGIH